MKKPILRTEKFEMKLSEAMRSFGFKYDYDPYDDIFHEGYRNNQAKEIYDTVKEENGGEDLKEVFPSIVTGALEDVERCNLANKLFEKAKEATLDNLKKICVHAKYVGIDSDGEEFPVSEVGEILEATCEDNETIVLTISNPEHLINDIIDGAGQFYPHEILVDVPQTAEVQSRLHWLRCYFGVYRESYTSEVSVDYSDHSEDDFNEMVRERIDMMENEEIASEVYEYLIDNMTPESMDKVEKVLKAFKLSNEDLDKIKNDLKLMLQGDIEKRSSLISKIKAS